MSTIVPNPSLCYDADSNEDLIQALDEESLSEFEHKLSLAKGTWDPTLFAPGLERLRVRSLPPVTLYVGMVPPAITETGLRNVFLRFGDLLEVQLIRNRSGCLNFGFVTFCRRMAAEEAIKEVSRKPPLHLVVNFKRNDRQKVELAERQTEWQAFSSRWDRGAVEQQREDLDWDEQIAREEKMRKEVDKFFSSDEDEEPNVVTKNQPNADPSATDDVKENVHEPKMFNTLKKLSRCGRCRQLTDTRCARCRSVWYCSSACQGLDWPIHKRVCSSSEARGVLGLVESVPQSGESLQSKSVPNLIVPTDTLVVDGQESDSYITDHVTSTSTIEPQELLKEPSVTVDLITPPAYDGKKKDESYVDNVDVQTGITKPPEVLTECLPIKQATVSILPNLDSAVIEESNEAGKDNFLSLSDLLDGVKKAHLESATEVIRNAKTKVIKEYIKLYRDGSRTSLKGSFSKESGDLPLSETSTVTPSETLEHQLRNHEAEARTGVLTTNVCDGGEKSVMDWKTFMVNEGNQDSEMPRDKLLDLALADTRRFKCEAWVDSLEFISQDDDELRQEYQTGSPGNMNSYGEENLSLSVSDTCSRSCQNETCVTKESIEQIVINNHQTEGLQINRPEIAESPENGSEGKWPKAVVMSSFPALQAGWLGLNVGHMHKVGVVNVESPTDVYLCPDMDQLARFQKHICSLGASLPHKPDFIPFPGAMVLVKSLQDGNWYRGLVERREEYQLEFFCPDFGFKEVVDLAKVRPINERLQQSFFSTRKFLACRCVLSDWRDYTGPISDRELRNLKKLLPVSAREIRVSVMEETELGYVVDIPGVNRNTVAGKDKVEREQEELAKLRMDVEKYKYSLQNSRQGLIRHS